MREKWKKEGEENAEGDESCAKNDDEPSKTDDIGKNQNERVEELKREVRTEVEAKA